MKTAESFKTLNVWTSAPEPPRDCGRRGFAAAHANASVAAAFWNFRFRFPTVSIRFQGQELRRLFQILHPQHIPTQNPFFLGLA